MEKEFVPYELALELKELGFDEPCFSYYKNDQLSDILEEVINSKMRNVNNEIDDYISASTFSQAFRWFREKYNLFGCIDLQVCTPTHWYIRIDNIIENDYIYHSEDEGLKFNTYEEAELACLRKLIEIVKQ
jgi:hypothetical protein